MLNHTVYNTSQICLSHGIRNAVFSPGSRNAPLTISFARNKQIEKYIIPDERSAGFVALGLAQKLDEPVVLCCTSGTALLNYAPAVAEAYYRQIPLVILSADRPPELIDQRDGQTIRQFEALKNHVKLSVQLPVVTDQLSETSYENELSNALEKAKLEKGPVHINIPFKEPFYPDENQELIFDRVAEKQNSSTPQLPLFPSIDFSGKKVLLLIGQQQSDSRLSQILSQVESRIPIIKSSLNNLEIRGIEHVDLFIREQSDYQPDILITSGLSVLSKNLKNYLRNHKPKTHYHIDPLGVPVDTYHTNPMLVQVQLEQFLGSCDFSDVDDNYLSLWESKSLIIKEKISDYMMQSSFSETLVFHEILKSLPSKSDLHLSNSMPVRFADMFGVGTEIESWSNRGASGIDGCTSTAFGSTLASKNLNVLLTGDVAFFYDRNAFFNNYLPPNLRIIVSNNSGGGIFRLIDGPLALPELETYFETRHKLTAEYICLEKGISYIQARNINELNNCLEDFYSTSNHPVLLEVFTEPTANQEEFKKLKNYIHEHIEL